MPISFMCPLCRHKVKVSRKYCGKDRDCPACKREISVPELRAAPDVEIDEQSEREDPPPLPEELARFAKDAPSPTPAPPRAPLGRTPSASRSPTPSASRTPGASAAHGGKAHAQGKAARAFPLVAVGAAFVLGLVLAGAALEVAAPPPPAPAPPPLAPPPGTPSTDVTPGAEGADPGSAATELRIDPDLETAQAAMRKAERLEADGKEREAERALELALAVTHAPSARLVLGGARAAFVGRCQAALEAAFAEVRAKALAGDGPGAQKRATEINAHLPSALGDRFVELLTALNAEVLAKAPRESQPPAAVIAKPERASKRPDELARLTKLADGYDALYGDWDVAGLRRALLAAGTFTEADIAAIIANLESDLAALEELAAAVRDGVRRRDGATLELVLWSGPPVKGRLARFANDALSLDVGKGEHRDVGLTALEAHSLALLAAVRGSVTSRELLALGVLANIHGEERTAHDYLSVSSEPAAQELDGRIVASEAFKAEPRAKEPAPAAPAPQPPAAATPATGPVTERWPSGAVKVHYSRDSKGRISGTYVENYESGKIRIRAHYDAGQLAGEYFEYHQNGKVKKHAVYKKGLVEGDAVDLDETGRVTFRVQYVHGKPLITSKTPDEIEADLAMVDRAPVAEPRWKESEFAALSFELQARALRRLRAYRYLSGVPWDVDLDPSMAEVCTAASQLLQVVGHLTHTPDRPPGVSDALYKTGYEGTSHSNIYENTGGATAVESVDAYMSDSDKKNIERVGHRRWCLNPAMKKTAFGAFRNYSAMYSMDDSRKAEDGSRKAARDRVLYPNEGWYPARFVDHDAAWSISLDADRYRAAPGAVRVTACSAADDYAKTEPVPIADLSVNNEYIGMPLCIIFRPTCGSGKGLRLWVSVEGVTDKNGEAVPIEYLVELY
jgi:hypothetical protein